MNIRPATPEDFSALYTIGTNTPELQVSATEVFMDDDEFMWSLTNPKGVFLVAEVNNRPIGFIYASATDMERPFAHKYACLVYLVVIPEYRRKGVAQKLYLACETALQTLGITNIYVWANNESNGEIISFMKKNNFTEGHTYTWMDKKIGSV